MGLKAVLTSSRTSLLVLALMMACAGAAKADRFQNGQFVTYDAIGWSAGQGATVLASHYAVYAPTLGVVTVGLPSPGFSISLHGSGEVLKYLRAGGPPAQLSANFVD